jgi:hypothetical protein
LWRSADAMPLTMKTKDSTYRAMLVLALVVYLLIAYTLWRL